MRAFESFIDFFRMDSTAQPLPAGSHHREKSFISGTGGTGAVFFSGCTLRCACCRNRQITGAEYARALNAAEAFGQRGILQDAKPADSSFTLNEAW